MNKDVIRDVEKYFNDYYDQDFIKHEILNNYELIEKNYKLDDEISFEVYMTAMLKSEILKCIIKRAVEEDIESEIFIIDKYSFVHDLYVRRNQKEPNNNFYEKAVNEAINTFDGKVSFISFLYKIICKKYEHINKSVIKKELVNKN